MKGFEDLIGQEEAISHIKNAILMDRTSHAYIISGPEGAGKKSLAHLFAAALQCEAGGIEPCGKCHSCTQMDTDSQPDVITLVPKKTGLVSVDDIREQIVSDISIKPYSSSHKIYIVNDAQTMNEQAQNALLKTLEEPPEYGIIFLLATGEDAFLPTIRSRCVSLKLKPVSDEDIKKYLMEKHGVPEDKADVCAAFAQGAIGKALLLANSEDFAQIRSLVIELMKRMEDIDSYEMSMAINEAKKYNITEMEYLDMVAVWFRDVLRFKATQDANAVIFRDATMDIMRQANHSSYSGIEEILEGIKKAGMRLRANVSYELTMELLLETIKENIS